MRTAPPRAGRLTRGLPLILGILAVSWSGPAHAEPPATLVVAVGGPLRRAKHPTGAVDLLRNREAGVAVTTLDQAVRGAWARGVPVRVLVAHTRAPAVVVAVSAAATARVGRVEDFRGQKIGIPG